MVRKEKNVKKEFKKENAKVEKKSKKKIIIPIISIFVILCIIGIMFLLGVFSPKWKKQIGFSDLKIDDDYIVGKIQNKTNKHLKVTITFELKSGSIKDTDYCYVNIEADTIEDLKCLAYDKNISYKVKVVDVETKEIKNKNFSNGDKISSRDFTDYFKEVYNEHHKLFYSIFATNEEDFEEISSYPYADEIEYIIEDSDKYLEIKNNLNYKGTLISVYEYFNLDDNKLESLSILYQTNDDILEYFKKWLYMGFIDEYSGYNDSYYIRKAISTDAEEGRCTKVGSYCFSKRTDDHLTYIRATSQFSSVE